MSELPPGFQSQPDQASSSYDPTKVYTVSTNGHDHSERVRVKVPPAIHGWIVAFLARGRVPEYRTPHDFVRDAIHHRMQYWVEHEADWEGEEILARERMSVMLAKEKESQTQQEEILNEFEQMVRHLERNGQWNKLEEVIARMWESMEASFKEGWLDKCERLLREAERVLNAGRVREQTYND